MSTGGSRNAASIELRPFRTRIRRRSGLRRAPVFLLPFLLAFQALIQVTPLAPAAIASAADPAPSVTVAAGASASVAFDVAVPTRPPAADILIAIDTTGSMGASIAQAKADATDIVNGVKASVADSHFAVVDFKDSTDGATEYQVTRSMTGVAADVQAAINAMSAIGGADAPEAHNLVFHNSYSPATGGAIGWRSGTKKVVVVISDAEPHGAGAVAEGLSGCSDTSADPHGYSTSTELAGMAAADRTLFMIRQASTATTTLQCYQSIVARTPGGVAVNTGTALGSQIVGLIDTSFTANVADLHLQVASATPTPATASWLSFTPVTRSAVPTPSTQTFTANVTVPSGVPAGTYSFDLASIADGADIGHTTLTVIVASALGVPNLSQAVPQGGQTLVAGVLKGAPSTTYHLRFVTSASCVDGVIGADAVTLGTANAITDTLGDSYFGGSVTNAATLATYVAAQIIPPGGSSEIGPCIVASPDNDQWPRALDVTGAVSSNGYIDISGRARWYKFAIQPGTRATISLSSLPADYDLFVFKDIGQAYTALTDTASLTKLSAEFAPSAFSPSAFSPSAFSPSAFSPSAFSPSAFSPSAFSPSAFSPSAFSPSAFSPSAFSPSAFSPSAFSPSAFSPSAFSPSAFSPSAFSPSGFSPSAFSGAQTRSLIGVSARDGTASETVVADTWSNTGYYYVRVSGKNGDASLAAPFSMAVTTTGNQCAGVTPIGSAPTAASLGLTTGGTSKTLIFWDSSRMTGNTTALEGDLDDLADRSEVAGTIVDLASNTRVQDLHDQADATDNIPCIYAKNLVAAGIKDIVSAYRSVNPNLEYIVLVGGDSTIPFFRYPDQSLLGEERDYDAPVGLPTASKASLAANFVLGQDAYGASTELSLRASTFPVPDLAVGRLVETAEEASGLIDAYLGTAAGVVATPTTSLVTGYDFLEDAANSVKSDLDLGIGAVGDSLISDSPVAPGTLCDPSASPPVALPNCSWDATALRTELLGSRHDLIYLAGHFSANNALAADYATTLDATELANAPSLDLSNSIIFSAGCHSGYNIVDADATGAAEALDWSQAFARRKATLIAGTGYQYGDTDFLEYSERIYAEFAHQLRVGTGPVSIGQALMRAKQIYLASTPEIRGLHEKALLESAIFGLPMLSINMPGSRDPLPTTSSIVTAPPAIGTNPGLALGLKSANVTLNPTTTVNTVVLSQLNSATPPATVGTVTATYYRGRDGVVTNPGEPALPLQSENVSVPGAVLRGVGFRSGAYTDSTIVPLTGAADTEIRGIHNAFSSTVFYPMRPWTVNYYDALAGAGGPTRLLVTPAQHKVANIGDQTATLRKYTDLGFRLYYSDYRGDAAQSAAPTINSIQAAVMGSNVAFRAHVTGDPAAGIQQVWITHNGSPNTWQSLDLNQSATDSTLWTGTLALTGGMTSGNLRFMAQAVNGVGLVAMDDNLGSYHTVTPDGNRPTISAAIASGTLGSNGWYTSNVVVRFTCHDGTGFGIASGACPANETLTTEGPAIESTARTVTDNAGFVSEPSNVITVKIDKTKPTITAAISAGTAGANGWHTSNVTVHFTCSDPGGSGIPSGACPADQVLSDEEAAVSSTAQMVSDNAGNTSNPSGVVTVKIDKTKPTVALVGGPANGSSHYFGSVPPTPSCTGADALSGLDTCTVTGYSTAVGPHTVTATATDKAGNSKSTSISYTVLAWTVLGFYQPTDMGGVINTVKNGSTVPLRFEIFAGTTELTNISAVVQPLKVVPASCAGGLADEIEVVSTGATSLRYDTTTGQFLYNWLTPKKPNSCYIVTVTAADGTPISANFKLK